MEKRLGIEGTAASRMVQLMRKHGRNKDVTIDVGTVTSPLPDFKIDVDGIQLDMGDLIVTVTVSERNPQVGDKVIVLGDDDTQFYYVIDKVVSA